MPALRPYHLFISHAWRYGDDYERLVQMLNNAPNFSYYNYSAPKENPLLNIDGSPVRGSWQIQTAIDRKITLSSCVLVISGLYYNNRHWMQYELESARQRKKPIIAIKPWGNERFPDEVRQYASVIVNWNTSAIVGAVREYSIPRFF